MLIRAVDSVPSRPAPAGAGRRAQSGSLYLLIALLAVLNLVGVVMVLSASSVVSLRQYNSPWHYFERQVLWLAVGTIAFIVALRVDYHRWRRVARPALVVTIGLLAAVLVPGIGVSVSGATRWLGTSSFQIQPSELAKLTLILFAADLLDRRAARGEAGDWRYQMMPVVGVFLVLAALVLKQPDMGTTLVLAFIMIAMLFVAGLPMGPLVVMFGVGALGSFVLAVSAPYRWHRMTSFLHPLAHADNTGYQASQALAALAHGHLTGDGIGASAASWGWLPNAQTDFIVAIIGEETGLVGTVLLSALFLGVGLVGIRIACGAKDRFGALLTGGITAWIVGQAVVNIAAVVGLLPVTGVPLPFVSFGGSSLVIALFATGIVGNVARRSWDRPGGRLDQL